MSRDDVIRIWVDRDSGWVARYVDGPTRPRILELFGTDTLPLPFTSHATSDDVVRTLLSRNPTARIERALA